MTRLSQFMLLAKGGSWILKLNLSPFTGYTHHMENAPDKVQWVGIVPCVIKDRRYPTNDTPQMKPTTFLLATGASP